LFNSRMAKLTAAEIRILLPTVPAWRREGPGITRTFVFPGFVQSMRFVNAVARLAERVWHHPEILIHWDRVTLTLTTHDEGGLTKKDLILAGKFDALANRKVRS
jgi:4a-hydroxytetrahydrobiopterin dehydratase